MDIREEVMSKIRSLPDDRMKEVYDFVEKIETGGAASKPRTLMQHLRTIKIDGPTDWSRNIDLYLSGEKKFEENID